MGTRKNRPGRKICILHGHVLIMSFCYTQLSVERSLFFSRQKDVTTETIQGLKLFLKTDVHFNLVFVLFDLLAPDSKKRSYQSLHWNTETQ